MADYRDESQREALHERVTTLQQELDGARSDLERERAKGTHDERLDALAADVRNARDQLASLQDRLTALQEERRAKAAAASAATTSTSTPAVLPKQRRATLLLVSGAAMAAAIVVGLAGGRRSAAPAVATGVQPHATAPTIPLTPHVVDPLAGLVPVAPLAVETRTVKATWPARVRLSSGTTSAQTAVGAACVIDADVGEQGNLPSLQTVAVRCGERVLYDSRKTSTGMRAHGSFVRQIAGKERGTLLFDVNYTDTGTGEAPQIKVDGSKGTVFLWHDYPEAFRIELTFARPSSPVTSAPLGKLGVAALDRAARVRQVRGRAAPAVGTMCTVHAMPEDTRSCYVSVDCGPGGALFGVTAFSATATCNAADVANGTARILDLDDPNGSAEATGGDPRVNLFTPPGRLPTDAEPDVLTVADEPKNGAPWSVELVLLEAGADAGAGGGGTASGATAK
jgi:hypothetical protein